MRLEELFSEIPCIQIKGAPHTHIKGIAYSSKSVKDGYLFAALKGLKSDGFDFINEAISRGASAVLSERPAPQEFDKTWIQVKDAREALGLVSSNFYSHPSKKMKVIGITGTKGKTTITYLLESITKNAGLKSGVIGTISYRLPGKEFPASRTTPEAPDLQRMMNEMKNLGCSHCFIEVSSHAIELKRVSGIKFDITVFTNLSGDHLDYHQTMEEYFAAKKKLFLMKSNRNVAVINKDDRWGKKLISELPPGTITYGIDESAEVQAEKYEFTDKGTFFTLKYPAGQLEINSPLLGRPNLYNTLAATAVSLNLNLPIPAIQTGILNLKGIPGRFEKIENSLGLNILVDYAHTDDALKNLLETAKELTNKRIIVTFGAGGDRDKTKRPRMGEAAGKLADWTIITSDNPRSEDPLEIITQVEAGIKKSGSTDYEIEPNRKIAIKKALEMGEPGDYILIAGKGHEDYQIIKDTVYSFKDTEIIREILKQMEES